MTLPTGLSAFGQYRQFILWRLVPGNPKPRKIPTGVDGSAIDPHDPAQWITHTEAYAHAAALGCGVGFVLTDNDPFFFLDIDNCHDGQDWSDVAKNALTWFPGAAVEVSQSGKGLHVFGTGVVPDGYGNKNNDLGIEFYTTKRFVALGQPNVVGDASKDFTEALAGFIPSWLPARNQLTEVGTIADWTTEPRPGYTGPDDDEALIAKFTQPHGAGQLLGGTCPVKALWEGDADTLARYFPDEYGNRDYDASSADYALASHLMFWTGGNCERTERLMWMSGLAREKWTTHKSYLRERTIIKAMGGCSRIYDVGNQGGSVVDEYQSHIITTEQQLEHFKDFVYIISLKKFFNGANGELWDNDQFDAKMPKGEYIFKMGGKGTDKPHQAFLKNQLLPVMTPDQDGLKIVDDFEFHPEEPSLSLNLDAPVTYLNTYIDPKVPYTNGDTSPFFHFFERMFTDPNDRAILLAFMAAVVQYQGVKFRWMPMIIGSEGNGKGVLGSVIKFCVGGPEGKNQRYVHSVRASNLNDGGLKFNSWIEGKIFVEFNEIHTRSKVDTQDALKEYITDEYMEIEGKGTNQRRGRNVAKMMAFSNHDDAVIKTYSDRRYAMFYTAQQDGDAVARDYPGDYLPNLWNWLKKEGGYEAMHGFLKNYNIPDDLNPATKCQRAPRTSVTDLAVSNSLGPVEQQVMEWVETEQVGFKGGWVSSYWLDLKLREAGLDKRISHNRRKKMMANIDYVPCPGLPNGRSTRILSEDGASKPILYLHTSRITEVGTLSPGELVDLYLVDNGRMMGQSGGSSLFPPNRLHPGPH